jgi:hypothetical protein
MDSLIAAAARALAAGDALGALKRISLREDPPALALRGIAMAQLGELRRARELLRRAARGFGSHEDVARARCVVAEAEVALAMRDLGAAPRSLETAIATLEARADRGNALHARLIGARRLLLLGRLGEAAAALARIEARGLPSSLAAVAELTAAELARARCAPGRRGRRSRARTTRPVTQACRRCSPKWRRRAPRWSVRPRGGSRPTASARCAWRKPKRSSPPAHWCSTRAVAGCAPAPRFGRWRAGRCCSRWRARSPRRGPARSTGKP